MNIEIDTDDKTITIDGELNLETLSKLNEVFEGFVFKTKQPLTFKPLTWIDGATTINWPPINTYVKGSATILLDPQNTFNTILASN